MCPTPAQQARGPDWLEYQPGSPIRPYYAKLPRAETDSLISDFNHRVLTQQPQRLLGAYARDVVKLFALTRDTSPGTRRSPAGSSRRRSRTSPRTRPGRTWRPRSPSSAGAPRPSGGPVAAFLRSYQLDGGYTPGPLLALCVVTGLAGSAVLLRRRWRSDPATRSLALACLLFFASGAFVLLVSDLFEFSWRYQLPALVTLVPAGALGIAVVQRALSRR